MEEQKTNAAVLSLVREFNAPRELVFEASTTAAGLAEWWGPEGYTMTVVKLELEPGGLCLFKMENEGHIMWARFVYREIKRPEVVEFILSFSDEGGGQTAAPFFENWPLEILNRLEFSENGGKTSLQLTCQPHRPTPEETASFDANKDSLGGGLHSSLERLGLLLQVNKAE